MNVGPSETRATEPPLPPAGVVAFSPGNIIAGRYRVVALVGRGGMGEVYRADDLRLAQPVALKFLPAALEHDRAARERLLAEVRNARNISHPNVCRVYDVGEVAGRYFLTMEYIDGEDLASLLRRIGRLPVDKALEVARQLSAGLAAAHERGVIHRDLKPANVMIDGRGHARITDFGLAVEIDRERVGRADYAGTMAYMAPERFAGKPATVRSDLYALGLILYETFAGKQAFTARSFDGWQRAHTDSTPANPSSLISEMDPAVERAIMRCLEKDPARRPASAALVAAALPGGDPLAAAIAAGETPSPELVAASGEEGTLPRAKAWLWLAGTLVALALLLPLLSSLELANLVSWDQTPAELRSDARRLLRDLGYANPPADSEWWIAHNGRYLDYLGKLEPPARRFSEPATAIPGALLFCYRQAPVLLHALGPGGAVTATDPAPVRPDDAYLTFHPSGRLVSLRVVPQTSTKAGGAAPAEGWPGRLFQAARLDLKQFRPVEPQSTPAVFADTRLAWEGTQAGGTVRIEAAAFAGRPVFFSIIPAWAGTPEAAPRSPTTSMLLLFAFVSLTLVGTMVILGVLARHNLRLGRGDRRGAFRLAMFVLVTEFLWCVLFRHWTFDPLWTTIILIIGQGISLFMMVWTWVYYLGLEPYMRRRWPYLLIAWTRLLDGQWRDPLVGRSLLAGISVGLALHFLLALAAAIGRLADLPDVIPFYSIDSLNALGWFLATPSAPIVAPAAALLPMTVLLIARVILGRDRAAWIALVIVMFVNEVFGLFWLSPILYPSLEAFLLPGALLSAAIVFVLRRSGLLATAVMMYVMLAIEATPVTIDFSRWYAWRTAVVVAVIVSLAVWGFRNVLGRQTAFPVAALDE